MLTFAVVRPKKSPLLYEKTTYTLQNLTKKTPPQILLGHFLVQFWGFFGEFCCLVGVLFGKNWGFFGRGTLVMSGGGGACTIFLLGKHSKVWCNSPMAPKWHTTVPIGQQPHMTTPSTCTMTDCVAKRFSKSMLSKINGLPWVETGLGTPYDLLCQRGNYHTIALTVLSNTTFLISLAGNHRGTLQTNHQKSYCRLLSNP